MNTVKKICTYGVLTLAFVGAASSQQNAPPTASTGSQASAKKAESASSDEIVPAFPIHLVNPQFPRNEKKKHAQGKIMLHATIATDGTVKDVSVVSSDPGLVDVAIEAVRQWRYFPSIRNGQPIEESRKIILTYDLGKRASQPENPLSAVPMEPTEDLYGEFATGELLLGGNGVTPPKPIYAPSPDYPKMAQKTRFQGDLELGLIAGSDGNPRSIWVIRPMGRGLDEKAIETVKQWRFSPAVKNGKPVSVLISVVISFKLY